MELEGSLPSDAVLCGTDYVLGNGNFDKLQTCFENLGFTSACALLWAHYTATSGLVCSTTCIVGLNFSNFPPPTCELAPCLNCSSEFATESTLLGGIGISVSNAGIIEAVARPCSSFTRVTYDPCVGAFPFIGTQAPKATSAAASSWHAMLGSSIAWMLLLLWQPKML